MATAGLRYGLGAAVVLVAALPGGTARAAVAGTPFSLAANTAQSSGNSGFAPAASHVTSNLGTFNIVIVPGAGLAGNSQALTAFNAAAQEWAARISDPITITINADLSTSDPLGNTFAPSTIGSTSSVVLQGGYDEVRDAMVADAAAQPAALNNQVVTSLPTAAQFTATLPAGRLHDGTLLVSKANAKALGFTGLDLAPALGGFGASDGTIAFNSAFTFDYNSSDGITPGTMDFQTVAAHEIGHLLGFFSSVDDIDATTAATYPSIAPTTLDLFRFARLSGKPSTVADFTSFARNLVPGTDTVLDDLTNEYRLSDGLNFDGRQASHWKDDQLTGGLIGIMDPTLSFGTTEWVMDSDLRALDLLGYDVQPVPEPAAASVLALGALVRSARRRRSRD